jgi:N-acetylglucosaminyldiphosphoundecaprenol N-acetyl-beta-D-mannosaminyltransferase
MKIDIFGAKIDSLTFSEVLNKIDFFINSSVQHLIVTANPEILLYAWKNENYLKLINQASLVTADGVGLLWAAKFLSLKKSRNFIFSIFQAIFIGISLIIYDKYSRNLIPERIAGVDMLDKICQAAAKKSWKIYLLGGQQGIAELAAEKLQKKYLNLNIVGAQAGPSQIELASAADNQQLIAEINAKQPDCLFVAFGAPKQEIWLNENLAKLASVKVAMGVGGAFNYLSGQVKRASEIYRDLNLEWLFRLINQPQRFVRIFNATFRFVFNVIKYKHLLK